MTITPSLAETRSRCHDIFGHCRRRPGSFRFEPFIGLLTPEVVHYGRADEIRDRRRAVLPAASAVHPDRFVRKPLRPPAVALPVWINQPSPTPSSEEVRQ